MNFSYLALSILAQAASEPSPQNVEFELAIWKWVVIISAGAFVLIFAVKRFADLAAKKKTAAMIETVVGTEDAQNVSGWKDDTSDD